jgi:hypothetical protein
MGLGWPLGWLPLLLLRSPFSFPLALYLGSQIIQSFGRFQQTALGLNLQSGRRKIRSVKLETIRPWLVAARVYAVLQKIIQRRVFFLVSVSKYLSHPPTRCLVIHTIIQALRVLWIFSRGEL